MAESHEVPALNCWISIALFTNVSNAAQLRGEATSGRIEAVLLDPTLVSAHPQISSVAIYFCGYEQSGLWGNYAVSYGEIMITYKSANSARFFKESQQLAPYAWFYPSEMASINSSMSGTYMYDSDIFHLCNDN